jgi:hypothetical protein
VSTDGGLITPIIKDVDKKGLVAIGQAAKELAGRGRAGKLKPEEYQVTIELFIHYFITLINNRNCTHSLSLSLSLAYKFLGWYIHYF